MSADIDFKNEDQEFHEVAYEQWWARNCPDSLQSPESESEANAIEAIKISFKIFLLCLQVCIRGLSMSINGL